MLYCILTLNSNGLFTNARTKFSPCDILSQIFIFKYLNSWLMVSFSEATANGVVWGGDKGGHEKERTGHGLHISFIEKHMAAGQRMIRSQQQTCVLSLQSQDRRMCNPEIPKWLLTPKGDGGAWCLKYEEKSPWSSVRHRFCYLLLVSFIFF